MSFCESYKHQYIFQKSKHEVADIFRDNLDKTGKINKDKWDVINDIISCRTVKLGGHILKCDTCNHEEHSYNSCRNRHCPKCQSLKKIKWIDARISELLPIDYFHVVFTIPDFFNALVLQNKKVIYDIFFKSVKETLLESSSNPKNLGAKIGFVSILHTWGQNLLDHPHIHCVVTGGGLREDNKKWISCKKDFFITVKILSKLFQGKFLYYLKESFKKQELVFEGRLKRFKNTNEFQLLIEKGYNAKWVIYSKKPFAGSEQVIRYLGKYTHRVAIGNSRIVDISNGYVKFKWKDYKDDNKQKVMEVSIEEFMRRFLLHVLPKRFVRIRFYGFLSNVTKREHLKISRKLLNKKITVTELKDDIKKETWQELLLRFTGVNISCCPLCKKGTLYIISDIPKKYFNNSS